MEFWRWVLRQWVFIAVFMFVGAYVLLGMVGPPYNAARAAFLALFTSTLSLLPLVLSRVRPISTHAAESDGATVGSTSWMFYACLMECIICAALFLVAPGWWKLVVGFGALAGLVTAYGIWRGAASARQR